MRSTLSILVVVFTGIIPIDAGAFPSVSVKVLSDRPIQRVGFFDWLFGGRESGPREPNRTERLEEPKRQEVPKRQAPERPALPSYGGTRRTLCVRLCDGFYFPISFATTRDKLADDASRCERQCPSGGRLFTHRNPGQSVDDMVDLKGNPYAQLPTAFRFREEYVADCTCRGNPWDAEAMARHQSYAGTGAAATRNTANAEENQSAERPRRGRYSSYRLQQNAGPAGD